MSEPELVSLDIKGDICRKTKHVLGQLSCRGGGSLELPHLLTHDVNGRGSLEETPPRSLAWRGARSLALPSNPLETNDQPNCPLGPEIPEPQGTPGLSVFWMLRSGFKGYKPGPCFQGTIHTDPKCSFLLSIFPELAQEVKRGQDGIPRCYLQYRCCLLGSQTTAR